MRNWLLSFLSHEKKKQGRASFWLDLICLRSTQAAEEPLHNWFAHVHSASDMITAKKSWWGYHSRVLKTRCEICFYFCLASWNRESNLNARGNLFIYCSEFGVGRRYQGAAVIAYLNDSMKYSNSNCFLSFVNFFKPRFGRTKANLYTLLGWFEIIEHIEELIFSLSYTKHL